MDYLNYEERRKVVDTTTANIAQDVAQRGYSCGSFKSTDKELHNSIKLCLKGRYGIVTVECDGLEENEILFIPEFYDERRRERIIRKFRREKEEIKKLLSESANALLEILNNIFS